MPVGRCVRRTALAVLLTCWPPAPLARKVSSRTSLAQSMSISTSSSSGSTSTRGEAGVPALLRVEGADPHQAVHAALAGEVAVGVGPADVQRDRADARPPRRRGGRFPRPCSRSARSSAGTSAGASRPSRSSRCRRRRRGWRSSSCPRRAVPDSSVRSSSCSRSAWIFSASAAASASVSSLFSSTARLVQGLQVVDPLGELAHGDDNGLEGLEFADDRLGGFVVVPEARDGHLSVPVRRFSGWRAGTSKRVPDGVDPGAKGFDRILEIKLLWHQTSPEGHRNSICTIPQGPSGRR